MQVTAHCVGALEQMARWAVVLPLAATHPGQQPLSALHRLPPDCTLGLGFSLLGGFLPTHASEQRQLENRGLGGEEAQFWGAWGEDRGGVAGPRSLPRRSWGD